MSEEPFSGHPASSAKTFLVILRLLLTTASIGYLVLYGVIVMLRIRYPYELEWLEGLMVDHVRRILDGRPLYDRPSLEFIPLLYTPLYYYICAAVSSWIGVGFLSLRLVSVAASIGCFGLIFSIVRRETGRLFPSLLATGLFAAMYRMCGAWLDLARVDSVFLFLLLGTIYLVRFCTSAAAFILAGFCGSAAFLTKQSALVVLAPLLLTTLVFRRRRSIFLLMAFAVTTLAAMLLLDHASSGWFRYYCFTMPGQHPLTGHPPVEFWVKYVMGKVPIAFVAAVICLVWRARKDLRAFWFDLAILTGALGASWLGYMKTGGYENVLLPTAAVLSLMGGQAVAEGLTRSASRASPIGRVFETSIYLAAFVQLLMLYDNPAGQIPGRKDAAAGERVVRAIGFFPGDVFIPSHGYLAVYAGKKSFAHTATLLDIMLTGDQKIKDDVNREFSAAIQQQRFDAIILDNEVAPFLFEITNTYRLLGRITPEDVFVPVTGMPSKPSFLFVRGTDAGELLKDSHSRAP